METLTKEQMGIPKMKKSYWKGKLNYELKSRLETVEENQ